MDLSQFDYLSIDPKHLNISHSKEYIHTSSGKNKHKRKIFDCVEYDEYEKQKVVEVEALIKSNKIELPFYWKRSDTLKYLYSSKFKPQKCLDQIQEAIDYRENKMIKGKLPEESQKLLDNGTVYMYGRDYQFRPVIMLDIEKIDTKTIKEDVLINALIYVLQIAKEKMFIPGIIENWIIFIEIGGKGLTGVPIGLIGTIIGVLSKNYNGCLEKLYLTNPSTSLKFMWGTISAFLDDDTKEKILFIKSKKEFLKIQDQIPATQLEERFGGKVKNIDTFYPPQDTMKQLEVKQIYESGKMLLDKKQNENQETWAIIENLNFQAQKQEEIKRQSYNNNNNNDASSSSNTFTSSEDGQQQQQNNIQQDQQISSNESLEEKDQLGDIPQSDKKKLVNREIEQQNNIQNRERNNSNQSSASKRILQFEVSEPQNIKNSYIMSRKSSQDTVYYDCNAFNKSTSFVSRQSTRFKNQSIANRSQFNQSEQFQSFDESAFAGVNDISARNTIQCENNNNNNNKVQKGKNNIIYEDDDENKQTYLLVNNINESDFSKSQARERKGSNYEEKECCRCTIF